MQKKAVQSEITSFCTKSLVSPLHYAVYIIQSPLTTACQEHQHNSSEHQYKHFHDY
jgi:hypothetical protein